MTLGDDLLRALDEEARRSGESRSRVIQRTLARQLAGSKIQQLRTTATGGSLGDGEATALAYGELRAARNARRSKRAASSFQGC